MSRLLKLKVEQKREGFEIDKKTMNQIEMGVFYQVDRVFNGKLEEQLQKRLKENNLEEDYLKEIEASVQTHLNRIKYLPESARYVSELMLSRMKNKIKSKYIEKINKLSSDKLLNIEAGFVSNNKCVVKINDEELISDEQIYSGLSTLLSNEKETETQNAQELKNSVETNLKEILNMNAVAERSVVALSNNLAFAKEEGENASGKGWYVKSLQKPRDFYEHLFDFPIDNTRKISALMGAIVGTVPLVFAEKERGAIEYLVNAGMGAILGVGVCTAVALMIPSSTYLYAKHKYNKANQEINQELEKMQKIEEILSNDYLIKMERVQGTNAFELEFANKNKVQQNAKEQELEQGK